MTLFDHFRPGRLSRQNTRSNPSSRQASPSGSPRESPHSTPHMGHFTALFTHHSDAHSHGSSSAASTTTTGHSSAKKREYEFFPHAPPIGSGGYSDVLKARWLAREGQVVAVKVVRKEAVKDHAEYLKIIGPSLPAPSSWFESSSKYYVTFPLLTGGELLERLNTRGRFSEDAARRVMRVMLETLAYIHSKGIIHRDIKPDNFLYRTPESDVDDFVIIDFGISKILDHPAEDDPKTQTEVAGTPGYAAPEVFRRTGYGKNQDVFGVGVIAYNLLSASSPWKAQEYMALIQETIRADPEFRPGPFRGVSEQDIADHVPALPHETHDPDRIPVPRPPTLKPDHPMAHRISDEGVDGVLVGAAGP
ncbi:hypothetical protein QFC20_004262 [Naganishia adeliensis]|uniref:Uncharacterized protein n=1 Tax=Naganishia adeliensis TaxID=92952 RepID=A0ACC2W203_9TREE|nr:hypothetical protein QFC20_004262 [Naganishia adeliensis]